MARRDPSPGGPRLIVAVGGRSPERSGSRNCGRRRGRGGAGPQQTDDSCVDREARFVDPLQRPTVHDASILRNTLLRKPTVLTPRSSNSADDRGHHRQHLSI